MAAFPRLCRFSAMDECDRDASWRWDEHYKGVSTGNNVHYYCDSCLIEFETDKEEPRFVQGKWTIVITRIN